MTPTTRTPTASPSAPGLEPGDPTTLQGVWEADYASLSPTARELRRHLVDFRNSLDQPPILTPEDVATKLAAGHLRPLSGGWLAVPLGADRRRILSPIITHDGAREASVKMQGAADPARALRHALTRPGAVRWSWAAHPQKRVPTAEVLTRTGFCPPGGVWLLVYGGSPATVLAIDAVTEALEALLAAAPVADVVFWHRQRDAVPVCYSIGAGAGDRGGELVEFPTAEAAARLRVALQKGAKKP